jgi:hypothetical protein
VRFAKSHLITRNKGGLPGPVLRVPDAHTGQAREEARQRVQPPWPHPCLAAIDPTVRKSCRRPYGLRAFSQQRRSKLTWLGAGPGVPGRSIGRERDQSCPESNRRFRAPVARLFGSNRGRSDSVPLGHECGRFGLRGGWVRSLSIARGVEGGQKSLKQPHAHLSFLFSDAKNRAGRISSREKQHGQDEKKPVLESGLYS